MGDELSRLRAEIERLTLLLAEAAPRLPPGRPRPCAYLEADVKELADAMDRWHRATNSILLPAASVLRIIRALGYRKAEQP